MVSTPASLTLMLWLGLGVTPERAEVTIPTGEDARLGCAAYAGLMSSLNAHEAPVRVRTAETPGAWRASLERRGMGWQVRLARPDGSEALARTLAISTNACGEAGEVAALVIDRFFRGLSSPLSVAPPVPVPPRPRTKTPRDFPPAPVLSSRGPRVASPPVPNPDAREDLLVRTKPGARPSVGDGTAPEPATPPPSTPAIPLPAPTTRVVVVAELPVTPAAPPPDPRPVSLPFVRPPGFSLHLGGGSWALGTGSLRPSARLDVAFERRFLRVDAFVAAAWPDSATIQEGTTALGTRTSTAAMLGLSGAGCVAPGRFSFCAGAFAALRGMDVRTSGTFLYQRSAALAVVPELGGLLRADVALSRRWSLGLEGTAGALLGTHRFTVEGLASPVDVTPPFDVRATLDVGLHF